MSTEKMRSEEVPSKFTEWLLSMGCPADKVPSQDKMSEMCRGQYHMVWRSLMEQVDARQKVQEKRLQVFCDDIRKCRKNNVYGQHDSSTIVPEELSLWEEQSGLSRAVEDAKTRLMLVQRDLSHLSEKVSVKMSSRSASRVRIEEVSRRAWLLRQLAAELAGRKATLRETREIAESLAAADADQDIKANVDKCVDLFTNQISQSLTPNALPPNEGSEQVCELLRGGGALCGELYARRAALVNELAAVEDTKADKNNAESPQSVLTHTAALQISLSLEATKNKLHLKQTRKKLLAAITDLNSYLSSDACELLVVCCEEKHLTARVASLRASLDDVTTRTGAFGTATGTSQRRGTTHSVDKDIEDKREQLKRVMSGLITTEHKIQSARDCLTQTLAAFSNDQRLQAQYGGVQVDLQCLHERYRRGRDERSRRVNLSMGLERSESSLLENIDYNNPSFVDELRFYLKKFNLENNRQLVLESGAKIWIFESLQASLRRLPAGLPAATPRGLLVAAAGLRAGSEALRDMATPLPGLQTRNTDITSQKEEEQRIVDRIKKRIRESLLELQKTEKTFFLAEQDLKFWAANHLKKYISASRKYDGMTYREYEVYYNENCVNV